jgi:hypothetical protein
MYAGIFLASVCRRPAIPRIRRGWFKRGIDTLIGRADGDGDVSGEPFFACYRTDRDILAVIVFLALALRIYIALVMDAPAISPELKQLNRLALSGGFNTDTPFVYPLFLRAVYAVFGELNYRAVYVIQGLVNTVVVMLMYGIVTRMWNRTAALVAAALSAVYPNFIIMCMDVGTTTFEVAFAVLLIAVSMARLGKRIRAVTQAGLLAIATCLQPLLVWFAPGTLVAAKKRKLLLLLLMLFLLPYTAYNANRHHKLSPVFDREHYHVSLEYYTGVFSAWSSVEHVYNSACGVTTRGWELVQEWPDERTRFTTYTAAYSYTVLMLLGFIGLARYYRREHRAAVAPVAGYTIILVLFSSFDPVSRAVLEPVLIAYAAMLLGGVKGWKRCWA